MYNYATNMRNLVDKQTRVRQQVACAWITQEKGGDGGEADWMVLEALALTFTRPMQKTTLVWTLGPSM